MRGVVVGVLLAWALSGHLAAEEKAAPAHLTVRSLSLVDAQGRTRAHLGIPERPGAGIELTLTDEKGVERFGVSTSEHSTLLILNNEEGKVCITAQASAYESRSLGLVRVFAGGDGNAQSIDLWGGRIGRAQDGEQTHSWPPK